MTAPARLPFWRRVHLVSTDPLAAFEEMHRRHGDVAQVPVGPFRVTLLAHPDDVRDVLVTHQKRFGRGRAHQRMKILLGDGLLTSEGALHLRQRRLAQPAFSHEQLPRYAASMTALAVRSAEALPEGMAIDIHERTMELALAIAARTLFGANLDEDARRIGDALDHCLRLVQQTIAIPWVEHWLWLPIPAFRKLRHARQELNAIVERLVTRQLDGSEGGELLALLVAARDDEGDGTGMSAAQLRDEVMTLLIAGHETTANLLAFALWLLAGDAEAQARWQAEADALGRDPTFEDLPQLPFTRAIAAETMRLYPPAYIIGRRVVQRHETPSVTLEAGNFVVVAPWITQRDARWWPEPTAFRPARWLTPDPARPKYAYFPFGGGTRQCIGEQFAWMEAVLVLAVYARRLNVQRAAEGPPVLAPSITLRPKALPLVVRRREAAAR